MRGATGERQPVASNPLVPGTYLIPVPGTGTTTLCRMILRFMSYDTAVVYVLCVNENDENVHTYSRVPGTAVLVNTNKYGNVKHLWIFI